MELDPVLAGAAATAISLAFPELPVPASFSPTSPPAKTAFSGSAVIELQIPDHKGSSYSPNLVVLKHSAHRAASLPSDASPSDRAKAEKTDKSSVNEALFLQLYTNSLQSLSIRIPNTYYTSPATTTILMESFSHWSQHSLLPPSLTPPTLQWLAKFHAAFLPQTLGGSGLPLPSLPAGGGWQTGTHLALSRRPPAELATLPATLAAFATRFAPLDEYFASPAAQNQGERLAKVTPKVAKLLEPTDGEDAHTTMVHGDYKQGNFFFSPTGEISVFDWQWTGPGIGATDLIYVCVMALSDDTLADYENTVLKVYYEHLAATLGSRDKYCYEAFVREFKLATLDYQRWQGGSRCPSMTPASVKNGCEVVDVNHGIYRRSVARNVWTWKLVDAILDDIDRGEFKL